MPLETFCYTQRSVPCSAIIGEEQTQRNTAAQHSENERLEYSALNGRSPSQSLPLGSRESFRREGRKTKSQTGWRHPGNKAFQTHQTVTHMNLETRQGPSTERESGHLPLSSLTQKLSHKGKMSFFSMEVSLRLLTQQALCAAVNGQHTNSVTSLEGLSLIIMFVGTSKKPFFFLTCFVLFQFVLFYYWFLDGYVFSNQREEGWIQMGGSRGSWGADSNQIHYMKKLSFIVFLLLFD